MPRKWFLGCCGFARVVRKYPDRLFSFWGFAVTGYVWLTPNYIWIFNACSTRNVEAAGRVYFPLPDLSRKIERDSARRVIFTGRKILMEMVRVLLVTDTVPSSWLFRVIRWAVVSYTTSSRPLTRAAVWESCELCKPGREKSTIYPNSSRVMQAADYLFPIIAHNFSVTMFLSFA